MKPIAQKLNKTDMERFRENLELQREEAREFLRRAEEEQKALDTDRPPELGDFCVESATREYLFERASQQRRLLNRIERALQRMQAGTFGECIVCGEEIQDIFGYGRFPMGRNNFIGPMQVLVAPRDADDARVRVRDRARLHSWREA